MVLSTLQHRVLGQTAARLRRDVAWLYDSTPKLISVQQQVIVEVQTPPSGIAVDSNCVLCSLAGGVTPHPNLGSIGAINFQQDYRLQLALLRKWSMRGCSVKVARSKDCQRQRCCMQLPAAARRSILEHLHVCPWFRYQQKSLSQPSKGLAG